MFVTAHVLFPPKGQSSDRLALDMTFADMNARKKQWTTVFRRIAEENPKLETIDWQASDEISYNWLVSPLLKCSPRTTRIPLNNNELHSRIDQVSDAPAQAKEVQERAQTMREALPFPPVGQRREVLMDLEGRVELGPVSTSCFTFNRLFLNLTDKIDSRLPLYMLSALNAATPDLVRRFSPPPYPLRPYLGRSAAFY